MRAWSRLWRLSTFDQGVEISRQAVVFALDWHVLGELEFQKGEKLAIKERCSCLR